MKRTHPFRLATLTLLSFTAAACHAPQGEDRPRLLSTEAARIGSLEQAEFEWLPAETRMTVRFVTCRSYEPQAKPRLVFEPACGFERSAPVRID